MNFKKIFILLLVTGLSFSLILTGCGKKQETKEAIRMATNVEFLEREADGIPALEKKYGFTFNRDNLITMKTGLTYDALKNDKVDVGMGFATDGRIPAFDLVNLKDDKNFFPVYNPAPTVRKEIITAYPTLADNIKKLSSILDQETLANLNKVVDIEGKDPEEAAHNFLEEKGLLNNEAKKDGPKIIVSSKPWTEQLILGNMLLEFLEVKGYPVEDRTSLGETPVLRKAMESEQIDIYWEYTGTILMTAFKATEITEAEKAFQTVKKWDQEENDIIWLDYAPANNTYTLMMNKEKAKELEIETITDLANYINR